MTVTISPLPISAELYSESVLRTVNKIFSFRYQILDFGFKILDFDLSFCFLLFDFSFSKYDVGQEKLK